MNNVSRSRYVIALVIGIAMMLVTMYMSLTSGAFDIKVMDIIRTLLRMDSQPDQDLVIFEFRLPRIIIAMLVGMGLAIAGAVIQSITRNGLADPGILGINSGAGAAMVIFLFFYQGQSKGDEWTSILAMPLFGLIGGLLAAFLIYLFSWKNGKLESQRLLLTGIAIASGLGAVSLYLTLKMNPNDFEMAVVWNSGSIYNANWKYIISILPWFVLLVPVIVSKSYILDLFQLDEDSVISVGVASQKEKAVLLLSSIGIVSACVSVSGGIGFIGLMAPHIAKYLVGNAHRRIIPVCGVVGALLVMISDYISKTVFAPAELPVGIVTAIIGVPYFIFLLYRKKGRS
ncbi:bacillibactin ABC transporter integral membrane protein [Aneurinibacillus thermoaerophilus]|uniref:Bacillibactin ABC transporter integral membrane protein n=2 Tax=Aneurinibacillus thermoaerophilus TaxID=143495 RepID=A0A1G7Y185_ANETH|nr:bacillibactin ABC transporter integral membrane protein [Aneurinibacillus thermoaerophilus]